MPRRYGTIRRHPDPSGPLSARLASPTRSRVNDQMTSQTALRADPAMATMIDRGLGDVEATSELGVTPGRARTIDRGERETKPEAPVTVID